MPIKVACQCGQRFVVKDSFAGKTVKCPKCGRPLKIPNPNAPSQKKAGAKSDGMSDLLDEVGLKKGTIRCPGCGGALPEDAVLCVACGYDLRLGHRIKPRIGTEGELEEDEFANLPTHGNPILDEAERRIVRDKIEQKRLSKGVPWWVLLLALIGLIGFAAGMVSLPQDRVMEVSGYSLMGVGGLLAAFFWLRIIIVAFQDAPLHGILSLLIPIYVLYYASIRWSRVGGMLLFVIASSVVIGGGFGLVKISEMVDAKKNKQQGLGQAMHLPAVQRFASAAELAAWRPIRLRASADPV